jgi:hypothetical protein
LRARLVAQKNALDERIRIDVDMDAGEALREMERIERQIRQIDGKTAKVDVDVDKSSTGKLAALREQAEKLNTAFGNISKASPYVAGALAAVGGAAAAVAGPGMIGGVVTAIGVKGGLGLLGAFDQLEKETAKFETVFGNQAEAVREWADALSSDIGMGTKELEGYAASVQDLLVPQGFSRSDAADITQDIVERGAALAQFNGKEAADGIDAVNRAMLGERDALKQLGVSVTQFEVDQREAMLKASGNYKGLNDKQLETIATMELVKEKSGDAWTAFNEGSSTADNLLDNLNTTLANLKTDAIEGFGGILVGIIEDLGDMNGGLGDLGDWINSNGQQLRDTFVDVAIFIADSAESAFDLAKAITTAFVESAPFIGNTVRVLGTMTAHTQSMVGSMLLLVPGMRDTGKALLDSSKSTRDMANSAADAYENFAEAFGPGMITGIDKAKGAVSGVGESLRDLQALDDLRINLATELKSGDVASVKSQLKELSKDQLAVIIAQADRAGATQTDKELAALASKQRKALIEAEATKTSETASKLAEVAKARKAEMEAVATNTGSADASLDGVAKGRTAKITADALTATAEAELNHAARDRVAKIRAIQTVATSGAYATGGKSARSSRAAGGSGTTTSTTNTTTTRVVNVYATDAYGTARAVKRALEAGDVQQGRQPGAPLAVAW